MMIYHWILLTGFVICFISCLFQVIQIFSNKPRDYAASRGKIGKGIVYSFTGAMSPLKKETAYLHLPSYTLGIIFHLGTFLSFLWLILHFFNLKTTSAIVYSLAIFLTASSICGVIILIKRIINTKMRFLSHPDDYFSNLLVTGFQALSVVTLTGNFLLPLLFIWASILFLYIPISKLRHVVYFFTSRIHLGMFYGKRGVWQIKR